MISRSSAPSHLGHCSFLVAVVMLLHSRQNPAAERLLRKGGQRLRQVDDFHYPDMNLDILQTDSNAMKLPTPSDPRAVRRWFADRRNRTWPPASKPCLGLHQRGQRMSARTRQAALFLALVRSIGSAALAPAKPLNSCLGHRSG